MSTRASPASRLASASWRWWVVNFGFRPITTPLALARSLPSLVRLRINSRSNSAGRPAPLASACREGLSCLPSLKPERELRAQRVQADRVLR